MRIVSITIAATIAAMSWAMPASSMEIRLCTGKTENPYHIAGDLIAQAADDKHPVSVVKDTGGTWANIEKTVLAGDARKCDAMIGQPDGVALLAKQKPAAAKKLRKIQTLHKEYLHFLCGTNSGVDELSDIEDDPKAYSIAMGKDGSGSWLFWQNFIVEDPDFATVPTKPEGGSLALSGVASGDTTCMIVPAGLGNVTVREADNAFAGQIDLVDAVDKDLNDALDHEDKPLYTKDTIPGDTYETYMQKGWGGAIDTISWRAGIYINLDAFQGQDGALESLIKAVNRARPTIIAEFDGE